MLALRALRQMEPQNIRVTVEGRCLVIDADLRGPGQNRTQQYVLREWSVGPYRRSLDLPTAVDVQMANAPYDNGVMVVILPLASTPGSGRISIPKVGTARGRLVQHVGMNLRPV